MIEELTFVWCIKAMSLTPSELPSRFLIQHEFMWSATKQRLIGDGIAENTHCLNDIAMQMSEHILRIIPAPHSLSGMNSTCNTIHAVRHQMENLLPGQNILIDAILSVISEWDNKGLSILLRQKYISAIFLIVVCTTVLFIALAVREVHELKRYLGYVAENGKSALFHEESINHSIATRLSRAFYTRTVSAPAASSERAAICQSLEKEGDIYGFNLLAKKMTSLNGTLQTRNKSCENWAGDISALSVIHTAESRILSKYSFSNYTGYRFRNIRYYIDLSYNYIYINQLVNTKNYTFNNWLVGNNNTINIARSAHTISIDDSALNDLLKGESTLSHIYQDGYTHNNIISMLTPVFLGDKVKGVLITDVNINDLVVSFKTVDRPLLWKFLSLYVTDNETGTHIFSISHKSNHMI